MILGNLDFMALISLINLKRAPAARMKSISLRKLERLQGQGKLVHVLFGETRRITRIGLAVVPLRTKQEFDEVIRI
jgi:hypothetical protein